nr:hypothetical protein [Tanacetum cinerariifolium]
MALHSLIALKVIDLDRPFPYTSHPLMELLGIAIMASIVSGVLAQKLLER